MAPTHHPSGQALANFLIGDCSPGAGLLITRHVSLCARCASRVQAMGSVEMDAGALSCGETETLGPGLEITLVQGASGLGEAVFCVRAAAGLKLPLDEPLPTVELLVIEGAVMADGVGYFPGDFLSLEETPKGQLQASLTVGCAYLMTAHAPSDPAAD